MADVRSWLEDIADKLETAPELIVVRHNASMGRLMLLFRERQTIELADALDQAH